MVLFFSPWNASFINSFHHPRDQLFSQLPLSSSESVCLENIFMSASTIDEEALNSNTLILHRLAVRRSLNFLLKVWVMQTAPSLWCASFLLENICPRTHSYDVMLTSEKQASQHVSLKFKTTNKTYRILLTFTLFFVGFCMLSAPTLQKVDLLVSD